MLVANEASNRLAGIMVTQKGSFITVVWAEYLPKYDTYHLPYTQ